MKEEDLLNYQSAQVQCQLATVWKIKGKIDRAIEGYQEALRLQPNYINAYEGLGKLLLEQKRFSEAIECYDRALTIDFSRLNLSDYYRFLGWNPNTVKPQVYSANSSLVNNPNGKINLANQKTFNFHRSGWSYAIKALESLHNSQGILFDGFLENNFLWKYTKEEMRSPIILAKMKEDGVFEYLANAVEKGIIPYTEPWVGFIHNPPKMPVWFSYKESPRMMFSKDVWKQSLEHCIGLFSLSNYHADWLREQTGKVVSVLYHPTEIPDLQFNFQHFLENTNKKIVQIGWWVRKLNAIYQLPIPKDNALNYQKVRLVPWFSDYADQNIKSLMSLERKIRRLEIADEFLENTRELSHLSNSDYDQLLSENIAFVELYDASANNAVIECIARATPLLINPLPSVIEYLGEDYPLYFNSLEEAANKAMDLKLISATHQYLKNSEMLPKLSEEYFLESFQKTEVYQMI